MVLIISCMPELSDTLIESIQLPDVDPRNIFVLPVPETLVNSGNADRISVVLKTVPKDETKASDFYKDLTADTTIMHLRIGDSNLAHQISKGAAYTDPRNLGYLSGKLSSELSTFTPTITKIIGEIKDVNNVLSVRQMTVLRDFLAVHSIQDCIEQDINCLAEDWDVAYAISMPLVFPDPPNYKTLIIGVEHSEADLTTLGLFDAVTNQEVVTLPRPDSQGGIYFQWIARSCSQTPQPCTEVPVSAAPGAKTLFLRERVYGAHSYDKLVTPFVLQIRQ
jgi:hypothetical protein